MWNNPIFITEMLGTFLFMFLILFIILASKSKVINLKKTTIPIFNAIAIGFALAISMIVGQSIAKMILSTSSRVAFLNPAISLMVAIATNYYDFLLSSIVGQLIGTIAASLIVLGAMSSYRKSEVAMKDLKETFDFSPTFHSTKKLIVGEFFGSIIFLGTAIAALYSKSESLIGFTMGIGFAIALMTFGLRFTLVLNPFTYLIPIILGWITLLTKPNDFKIVTKEIFITVTTNFFVSGTLGVIVYGLTMMNK